MPKLKGLSEKFQDAMDENRELKKENEELQQQLDEARQIINKQRVQLDLLHLEQKHTTLQRALYDSLGVIS